MENLDMKYIWYIGSPGLQLDIGSPSQLTTPPNPHEADDAHVGGDP